CGRAGADHDHAGGGHSRSVRRRSAYLLKEYEGVLASGSLTQARWTMHEQPDAPGEHIGRPPKGAEWLQRPRIRLGAIVALAVAAGIVAWAVVDRSGSSKPSAPASSLAGGAVGPVLLTPEALRAESRSL